MKKLALLILTLSPYIVKSMDYGNIEIFYSLAQQYIDTPTAAIKQLLLAVYNNLSSTEKTNGATAQLQEFGFIASQQPIAISHDMEFSSNSSLEFKAFAQALTIFEQNKTGHAFYDLNKAREALVNEDEINAANNIFQGCIDPRVPENEEIFKVTDSAYDILLQGKIYKVETDIKNLYDRNKYLTKFKEHIYKQTNKSKLYHTILKEREKNLLKEMANYKEILQQLQKERNHLQVLISNQKEQEEIDYELKIKELRATLNEYNEQEKKLDEEKGKLNQAIQKEEARIRTAQIRESR